MICIAQLFGASVGVCLALVTNRQLIHSTQPLHRIMPYYNTSLSLRQKIRFQTCYEIAHHKQQHGYTFGPLGPVTLKQIFEVWPELDKDLTVINCFHFRFS